MEELLSLVTGYKAFSNKEKCNGEYSYKELAGGQSPKVMVISCSDSRVIPSHIFNVKPGDLFVVRNVANLVPPFANDRAHHGTSAALEFAVLHLSVERIVIMGHSQCGGIQACHDNLVHNSSAGFFIDQWLSILEPIVSRVLTENQNIMPKEKQRTLEEAAIRASINNLKTFPFITEKLASQELTLHGAYFDIQDGQLYLLNKPSGEFISVD